MRITAITQHGSEGRATLRLEGVAAGINAIYGPPRSGKTLLADVLGHALFGKTPDNQLAVTDAGEVIIDSEQGRHRVRRYRDGEGHWRLTVASLEDTAAHPDTIRRVVGGLPPAVLGPLCAVSFRKVPDVAPLLSAEFARSFQTIMGSTAPRISPRLADLAARRDQLAAELESRIAGERRVSKELEARWRELDRQVHDEQRQMVSLEQRLHATEAALAETDARLRYRRLELNVELRWQAVEPEEAEGLNDHHEQAARLHTMLAELAQREAAARTRLAEIEAKIADARAADVDQQAWLAVARQLAADLAGEVARLARATASEQCVCRDAHPRLRPISEAIERQLQAFQALVEAQQRLTRAAELQAEVDHLVCAQAALRRHADHLGQRRDLPGSAAGRQRGGRPAQDLFTAADAQQLESRRMELEHERFTLVERLRSVGRKLRDLRAQRETVDRQRAALLSARSIEHVQRELASVQQKLEQAAGDERQVGEVVGRDAAPARASDYLAQLSDGQFVRLVLVEHGRRACVVSRGGETLRVESLTATERGQVYLSLCLALLSAAARQGVWLPLVLDEPFEGLEQRAAAALCSVLEDFAKQGHQILALTADRAAAERLASLGAAMHTLGPWRKTATTVVADVSQPESTTGVAVGTKSKKRPARLRDAKQRARKTDPSHQSLNGTTSETDRSDAA